MVNKSSVGLGGTKIKIIPTSEIKIYQVKESELEQLEHGGQSDLFLEIGIACISVCVSFAISLFTTKTSLIVLVIFTCIALITAIAGIVLLFLWHRCKKSRKDVIDRIKRNERTE